MPERDIGHREGSENNFSLKIKAVKPLVSLPRQQLFLSARQM